MFIIFTIKFASFITAFACIKRPVLRIVFSPSEQAFVFYDSVSSQSPGSVISTRVYSPQMLSTVTPYSSP